MTKPFSLLPQYQSKPREDREAFCHMCERASPAVVDVQLGKRSCICLECLDDLAALLRPADEGVDDDKSTIENLRAWTRELEENLKIAGLRAARIAELEAIVTECDPALIARREKMHDVSMEYYALLDKLDGATSDELVAIKNHLDELSAPFSGENHQAFVAFLAVKRMLAESSAERYAKLQADNARLTEQFAELTAALDEEGIELH